LSNVFVDRRYDERIARLALGVEPLDAVRGGRLLGPVRVLVEDEKHPLHRWRTWRPGETIDDALSMLPRHHSGRFARLYGPRAPGGLVGLRVVDRGLRRIVPRRFEVGLADEADVAATDLDPAGPHPIWRRVFPLGFFPGSAAPLSGRHTVVRGRVLRSADEVPVRWARVRADDVAGDLVGWAHGDDRGEFVLVIGHADTAVVVPDDPLEVELTVHARLAPPPPDPLDPLRPVVDPIWDLPREVLVPAPAAAGSDRYAGRADLPGQAPFGPFPFDLPHGRETSVTIRIP
jgi:hypothetical protein